MFRGERRFIVRPDDPVQPPTGHSRAWAQRKFPSNPGILGTASGDRAKSDLTTESDGAGFSPPDGHRLYGTRLFVRVILIVALTRRDGVGARQPTVQVDIATPLRAERLRRFGRRLAADRARFGARRLCIISWHSTSRSEWGNLRHPAGRQFHIKAGQRRWCRSRPS